MHRLSGAYLLYQRSNISFFHSYNHGGKLTGRFYVELTSFFPLTGSDCSRPEPAKIFSRHFPYPTKLNAPMTCAQAIHVNIYIK